MRTHERNIWAPLVAFALLAVGQVAYAVELKGYLNSGIWYLHNNTDSADGFLADDSYGQSYVQSDFAMFNASLDLHLLNWNRPDASTHIHSNVKGRFLYNIFDNPYTLAPPDQYRYQLDETNMQFEAKKLDLWIGRHTIYETGGIGVDGLTSVFKLRADRVGLGVYGGLGNDPRTLTGYIGPTYKTDLFNSDFYAGGAFLKLFYDTFRWDFGGNTLLFDKEVDRTNLFTQMYWLATPSWTFSGFADLGIMGDKGLQKGLLAVTTKAGEKFTNRFSFATFRSYVYSVSNISAIPPPGGLSPIFGIGTEVDTSEYYILRDEIQYRFERNYLFTGVEYGYRTYDDTDRAKYFVGYYDPMFLESDFDTRIQVNIIDNYRSFNSSVDLVIGRDFSNNKYRLEAGGTFYANERDTYLNNAFVSPSGEIEKEQAAFLNFTWNTGSNLSWFMNYAFYHETDVVNFNQDVLTHEVLIQSNLRF